MDKHDNDSFTCSVCSASMKLKHAQSHIQVCEIINVPGGRERWKQRIMLDDE